MPNSCPFKEEVLKEVEAGRQRKQEMKDKRRDEMKQRREEAKAQALEEKRTKVRALITSPGRINISELSCSYQGYYRLMYALFSLGVSWVGR